MANTTFMYRSLSLLESSAPRDPLAESIGTAKGHQQPEHDSNATPTPRLDSLYVHVPFCFHKCHYCDFYSLVDDAGTGDRQSVFADRLIAELRWRAGQVPLRPRTIFIGGGTPTLLREELWERLLSALADSGVLRTVSEFTVEANPETVTPSLMRLLSQGGVNRVSIGAQSFQPDLLKALERWHDPANVRRSIDITREAGITNINADLIFAIPGQTMTQLDADIDAAVALQTPHLSYYGLTYEPNTALTKRRELGRVTPIENDVERAMYERVIERLTGAGYKQYEVSAWARRQSGETNILTQHRCLHNLTYWTNGNWLGVGPAAASHINGHRWKNKSHLGEYLACSTPPPVIDYECLAPERRIGEELMLRLRLRDGVPMAWLKEKLPKNDPRWSMIERYTRAGLLECNDTHLRVSATGLLVADDIIAELL